MRKSLFTVLGTAATLGAALLTTTAASAAPQARAGPAARDDAAPTTVTFAIEVGVLAINAPDSAALGTSTTNAGGAMLPGDTISGSVGPVTVSDNRAALRATWTASVASTDFTTGGGSSDETIPATDATYDPGKSISTTGAITTPPVGKKVALSNTSQNVVTGMISVGNNSAEWFPTEAVAVPLDAVGGDYSSTLTESVL